MGWLSLKDHQRKVLDKMHNGCILCGDVGTGKSRTALAYYYIQQGGSVDCPDYLPMDEPKDLYVITTARKRDTLDWQHEMTPFLMGPIQDENDLYSHTIVIDSWQNIQKYKDVKDAFFIFDEQRLTGSGPWVKAFLKIAQVNDWILLSATPGDTWSDYIPVFVANGFYKNKSSFEREHCIFNPYMKFRKVDRYVGEKKLRTIQRSIVVDMPMERSTVRHQEDIWCDYDRSLYMGLMKNRWNPWDNKPIENASELCYLLRKCANSDESRKIKIMSLAVEHPRMIIFYNFDYELEILKNIWYPGVTEIAEWNGHKHDPLPKSERWVYLVQYTAGAEGWNCITTDTIVFFSQNYSYKIMQQSAGRIDRMNTPYVDLYYYHLRSKAPIDLAIRKALLSKKDFNAKRFVTFVESRK